MDDQGLDDQESKAQDTAERFAKDLQQLRLGAKLSVRGLADRAHLGKTAISRAEQGGSLPTAVVLAAYLKGLDITGPDAEQWEQRAQALREGLARSAPSTAITVTAVSVQASEQLPTHDAAECLPDEQSATPALEPAGSSESSESSTTGSGAATPAGLIQTPDVADPTVDSTLASKDTAVPSTGGHPIDPVGGHDGFVDLEQRQPIAGTGRAGRPRRGRYLAAAIVIISILGITSGAYLIGRISNAGVSAVPPSIPEMSRTSAASSTLSKSSSTTTSPPSPSPASASPSASVEPSSTAAPVETPAPSSVDAAPPPVDSPADDGGDFETGPADGAVDEPVTQPQPSEASPEPPQPPAATSDPQPPAAPVTTAPPTQPLAPVLLNPPVGPTVEHGRCEGGLVGEHNHKVNGTVIASTLIYYNSTTGNNCALLRKRVNVGEKSYVGLTLCNERKECATDRDYYLEEAGPVSVYGKNMCITFAISVLRTDRTSWLLTPQQSDPSHCQ